MAKKTIFYMLAGGLFFTLTNNAFAFDGFWNWYFNHPRFFKSANPVSSLEKVAVIEENPIIVTIINGNGSVTDIRLIPSDIGYIGPKGEYYSTMPSEAQLKSIYGLAYAPPVRNNVIFYLGKCNGVEKVVVLTKDGTGYIGPKGEYYNILPEENQLREIYCK